MYYSCSYSFMDYTPLGDTMEEDMIRKKLHQTLLSEHPQWSYEKREFIVKTMLGNI
jgi:hypothetical protein